MIDTNSKVNFICISVNTINQTTNPNGHRNLYGTSFNT